MIWCATDQFCMNIQGIVRISILERRVNVLWERLTITPTNSSTMAVTQHITSRKLSCFFLILLETSISFVSDLGGNTIGVNWYTTKRNLHRVWDDNIIETAEERFYDSNRGDFINAIQQNIRKTWADQVKGWENCSPNEIPCPDIYASESIEAACQWAYKGVTKNSVLEDDYFLSRFPVVTLRLAQAGVRLAASLNRIFGKQYAAVM